MIIGRRTTTYALIRISHGWRWYVLRREQKERNAGFWRANSIIATFLYLSLLNSHNHRQIDSMISEVGDWAEMYWQCFLHLKHHRKGDLLHFILSAWFFWILLVYFIAVFRCSIGSFLLKEHSGLTTAGWTHYIRKKSRMIYYLHAFLFLSGSAHFSTLEFKSMPMRYMWMNSWGAPNK